MSAAQADDLRRLLEDALAAHRRGAFREAVADYDKALAINPDLAGVHNNRAVALNSLWTYGAALQSCDAALRLAPDYAEAHNNRGIALRGLNRLDDAAASYDAAIRLKPDFAEAYYNRAITREDLKQYAAAVADYEKARQLSPAYGFLTPNILHARMDICDWRGLEDEIAALERRIMAGEKVSPFSVMALSPSLALQYTAASTWSQHEFPSSPALGPVAPHPAGAKIRIGYFSMEFHYSAFAVMSTGVFEAHDREKFEITAFSFGPKKKDAARARLEKAFDRFLDVSDQSDLEIAQLARSLRIDIAVDLAGHQRHARPGIFSLRAAPLQIQYQACPMGAADIDYFVTDAVFVPDRLRSIYRESIARLPRLLPSDQSRPKATRKFTRAELGLPEAGFVYCCFSATYKITPQMFGAWMRILAQVPGSVLWLAARNPTAGANLRAAAHSHGINPNRLVFAAYMEAADHLARHSAADLFLDTYPFNANSTSADALWAGLPVVTWAGEGIAGLGSASLLIHAGLSELVTTSLADYEALAVALGRDPARAAALKQRVEQSREEGPLFDINGNTRSVEKLYTAIIARQRQGLPPADIDIT